jgi:hypothetical protein
VTQREIILPYLPGDEVGRKVTLTVEAYVFKVEADLFDVSGYNREDPENLPGETFTSFTITKATRS